MKRQEKPGVQISEVSQAGKTWDWFGSVAFYTSC